MASVKDKSPLGIVIKILDEWKEGDRSYFVVVLGDERRGRVDIVPTFYEASLIPRERIRTDRFRVIAYCDAKGNLEMAGAQIGGFKWSLAREASRLEGQAAERRQTR